MPSCKSVRVSSLVCFAPAVLRRAIALVLLLGSIALAAPSARAETYDLAADWSIVNNPNGVWAYRAGNLLLTQTGHWNVPPDSWRSPYGQTIPHMFKLSGTFEDLQTGDIVVHSQDDWNGAGLGPSNITWTAPYDTVITISGNIWQARDIGRGNNWSLLLNGQLLTRGSIYDGDPYSRANPFDFAAGSGGPSVLQDIPVSKGDVVMLEVAKAPWSPFGEYFGVNWTVTATPANLPPSATDDFFGTDQGTSLAVSAPGVIANDNDPDADALTATLVAAPSHADLFQLNPDGSFYYTPSVLFVGEDSFTYRVSDGTADSEVATVRITVTQPGSQGFITGGGRYSQDGRKCTFGFVTKVLSGGVQGRLEFQDHDASLNVRSETVDWVYSPDPATGYFRGTCSLNGTSGYGFFVQVHDLGEPGSSDDLTIWLFDPLGNMVYVSGGGLTGGNVVIHGK